MSPAWPSGEYDGGDAPLGVGKIETCRIEVGALF
jgi:hypothetical protein